ncbi:hypothetical protein RhiJN_11078 [Ceratobasidium sp. AG-Ba]|nr:hypothetical protein RhiJN_11078 [Ceratobasidium sp. AG-Ba]QRW11790.1 hypothetical protein RhiLY_10789 [Ceratobasidium sp. AG-Ba]
MFLHRTGPIIFTNQGDLEELSPHNDSNTYSKDYPTGSPSTFVLDRDKIDEWAKKVSSWATERTERTYQISGISWPEAVKVQQEVEGRGCKPKLHWQKSGQVAIFTMTKPLHSTTMQTWTHEIFNSLRTRLLEARPRCLAQTDVVAMGDTCVTLVSSYKQPDQAFGVQTRHGPGTEDIVIQPRVVFESAVIQSETNVRDKAALYLTETKVEYQVHAVAILNFENTPELLPNCTILDNKNCRVTLEVWVRAETNNPDLDFPLDDCPQPPSSSDGTDGGNSDQGSTEDWAPTQLSDTSHSLETSFGSSSVTISSPSESLGHNFQVKRRGETIVLLDESQPVQVDLPKFVLDVYDFFRVCRSDPTATVDPDERLLDVPLERLQEIIRVALSHERYRLQELCNSNEDTAAGPTISTRSARKKRAKREPIAGFEQLSAKRLKSRNPAVYRA